MQALKDVRILDMTHVQAGPTCSQLLAWMGADVIKFEPPQGDATRGQLRDVPNADSLYFTMLNCNKRSITVNMKSAGGKEVFVDLLKRCDIVMENFGPGVLDRLGFTWEKIHEINPKIVMGSIKGFGSSGPYSDFKAYENVAQAMGWVMCPVRATTRAAASSATPSTAGPTAPTTGSTWWCRRRCGSRLPIASGPTWACPTSPAIRASPPSASGARTRRSYGRCSTSSP